MHREPPAPVSPSSHGRSYSQCRRRAPETAREENRKRAEKSISGRHQPLLTEKKDGSEGRARNLEGRAKRDGNSCPGMRLQPFPGTASSARQQRGSPRARPLCAFPVRLWNRRLRGFIWCIYVAGPQGRILPPAPVYTCCEHTG